MKRYITRTIEQYDTIVTFVMNEKIDTYTLPGVIGKKEAKKLLMQTFNTNDIIIVSCRSKLVSSSIYRMPEETFISLAEKVE